MVLHADEFMAILHTFKTVLKDEVRLILKASMLFEDWSDMDIGTLCVLNPLYLYVYVYVYAYMYICINKYMYISIKPPLYIHLYIYNPLYTYIHTDYLASQAIVRNYGSNIEIQKAGEKVNYSVLCVYYVCIMCVLCVYYVDCM
jgi:hypothetical protein